MRRGEQSRLADKAGEVRAKGGRFLLLKRGTRVRGKAREKLRAVLASLDATSRAWELKESFRKFWTYRSETWAAAYLKAWTTRAMRSRLEPMKKVARMLRRHEDLLLNYFRAKRQFTNAVTEGMNHKARVSLARSFGHRSFEVLKLVLYHNLEPSRTSSITQILLTRRKAMGQQQGKCVCFDLSDQAWYGFFVYQNLISWDSIGSTYQSILRKPDVS